MNICVQKEEKLNFIQNTEKCVTALNGLEVMHGMVDSGEFLPECPKW